jgi:hypothetical protein
VEGFLKHDEPLEISVADDGSELFLAGPSIVLTFEKVDANAGPRYEFRCWGDRVIVTA